MTAEERHVIQRKLEICFAKSDRPVLTWAPHPDPGFTALVAGPCPLLTASNQCMIWDVRPFNCRRFACGRVTTDEAYESEPVAPHLGFTGCANLTDRLEGSPKFAKWYGTYHSMHRLWAERHGWKPAVVE